jgi:hypothetical protein
MIPQGYAIILIIQLNRSFTVPAALVYRTQNGIGWVELGYFDSFPPPSPQWHEQEGPINNLPNGVTVSNTRRTVIVIDLENADPGWMTEEITSAFDWLTTRLQELKTTIQEQRLVIGNILEDKSS